MLGGFAGAAALASLPAYALSEPPSASRVPGNLASVLALAVVVALVVLVWQIFRAREASEVPVLVWLRAGYPELFDRPYLTERVWLYDICYQVRQLCMAREVPAPPMLQALANLTLRPRVRFR